MFGPPLVEPVLPEMGAEPALPTRGEDVSGVVPGAVGGSVEPVVAAVAGVVGDVGGAGADAVCA